MSACPSTTGNVGHNLPHKQKSKTADKSVRATRSVRIAGHIGATAAYEEIEVGALMRLLYVLDIEPEPAALRQWRGRPT